MWPRSQPHATATVIISIPVPTLQSLYSLACLSTPVWAASHRIHLSLPLSLVMRGKQRRLPRDPARAQARHDGQDLLGRLSGRYRRVDGRVGREVARGRNGMRWIEMD